MVLNAWVRIPLLVARGDAFQKEVKKMSERRGHEELILLSVYVGMDDQDRQVLLTAFHGATGAAEAVRQKKCSSCGALGCDAAPATWCRTDGMKMRSSWKSHGEEDE